MRPRLWTTPPAGFQESSRILRRRDERDYPFWIHSLVNHFTSLIAHRPRRVGYTLSLTLFYSATTSSYPAKGKRHIISIFLLLSFLKSLPIYRCTVNISASFLHRDGTADQAITTDGSCTEKHFFDGVRCRVRTQSCRTIWLGVCFIICWCFLL